MNGSKDYSAVKRYLALVNQTTDDFLFLFDIPKNENWFFGDIDKAFAVRRPGSEVNTFEEMLEAVVPGDRKALIADIEKIKSGAKDYHDMNYRWYNRRGEIVWVSCRGKVVQDENGMPAAMIGRVSEEALRHLFNPLTGLWNKTKLREDMKERLKGFTGYLMMIGIPSLTDINLTHGRSCGNQLLRELAELFEQMDGIENAYHIDSNDFALMLNTTEPRMAEEIFNRISDSVNEKCTCFAGVVPMDNSVFIDVPQLIDSAKITLKRAEESAAERIVFFSPDEISQRITALTLLEELKESVQNDFEGFEVYYQPQIRSQKYELYGVEALLRYVSPKRGRVFPDEFIPLLEQSGLIEDVGMWVLEQALRQCKAWREKVPSLRVAVNFSSVQFENPGLGERIVDTLKRIGLPGEALTAELTESVQLKENERYTQQIKYIKSYGVRFSIDDFGTGYSNIRYLKELDVSEIKIDRSFVSEIEKNSYNYRLIVNVLEFSKNNAIHACCEGVETPRELSVLEALQPDFFQGYLFDKPCTPEEIEHKYLHEFSDEYKARLDSIEELQRYKEQFGSIHFNPQNILSENNIGLWILRLDEKEHRRELHVNEVMESVLGLAEKLSPTECYEYWRSRISPEDTEFVRQSFRSMVYDKRAVELEYRWYHPRLGEVSVRSSGIRTADDSGKVVLEGYHRILNGAETD